ncbi:conserved hypothetical protein [Neospora caninum Liverpool]|uniref:Uncharacterized protein n=1 Tax=Neospora caninum (strain Liverpool) TaxID=572307 RepID=F0VC55_NEOCL|nr:conserved hypothetical protein [Neospora caninum Liverpool]CBZ51189.1 conserved hypothetical protein [Neospora caninum Liverpool]CEL68500.1 TPA: hypothetical protein BN1204_042560 [Neospora caninum Liverpool]|eukprot:XP_003881222.1 conserved hypothetical protein [Neospora caninum Liverpool]
MIPAAQPAPRESPDRAMDLLNATGAHLSVLLDTVEKQLKGLSTDLLPGKQKDARETPSRADSVSPSPTGAATPEEDTASDARSFAKNLAFVNKYHATCCSLNRLLHTEVEKMDRLREAVCGDSLYNAVLQVENLELLNGEKAKFKKLKEQILRAGDTL